MYENFVQERIAALRSKREVSARDMSLSIGQSESYINMIENKRSLPSLPAFFAICEYLGVTPSEFFDEGNANPSRLREVIADLKKLDDGALAHIAGIARELGKGR